MPMHHGRPSHDDQKVGNPCSAIFFVCCALLIIVILLLWSNRKPLMVGPLVSTPTVVQPEAKPQPITPAAAVVAVPLEVVYILKWGDTLTKLAKRTCDTPEAIAKRNGLTLASVIYAGKSIKLQMVERCSPESVKLNTFPEKFPRRSRAGASQEKSFVSPESGSLPSVSTQVAIQISLHCNRIGSLVRAFEQTILARAECIRTKYGEFIRDAITTIDSRLSAAEVVAIMINESGGNPRAVSTAADPCFGLMQLQGGTARQYGVRDVFDPKDNIFGGVRVLSDYVFNHAKGDHARGHASYNMGPYHRLLKNPHYDATRNSYVRNVARIQRVLEENQFSL